MLFEYDPAKNTANIRNHGVDFEEAITVFGDPLLMIVEDRTHSHEERLVAIGRSENYRNLFVVHCYRERRGSEEEVIRIISARQLSKAEKRRLEEL